MPPALQPIDRRIISLAIPALGSLAVEPVYVMVDTQTLTKTPIPNDIRAAFERGAPGVVTDHAGYW